MAKNITIIGSGLGGIATALRFASLGTKVTILEKNNSIGGRLNQLKIDDFTFDTGPSFMSLTYEMDELFNSIKVPNPLKMIELDPLYSVFFENEKNPRQIHKDLFKLQKEFLNEPDLDKLRISFYSAVENQKLMKIFWNDIVKNFGEKVNYTQPMNLAYFGVYKTLEAKHSFNPYTKLKKLQGGLELLEKAIKLDKSNLEIRFMRFSVLHYIPDFLGYQQEKESDAANIYNLLLKEDFTLLDKDIQKGIADFLVDSKRISKDKQNKLIKLYKLQ